MKTETEELKWESYNLSAEIRASMQYFFVGNMNKATNFSISFQNSCFSNRILLVLLIGKFKAILERKLFKIINTKKIVVKMCKYFNLK